MSPSLLTHILFGGVVVPSADKVLNLWLTRLPSSTESSRDAGQVAGAARFYVL